MLSDATTRFQFIMDTLPALLKDIPAEELEVKQTQTSWSKKQILGHLIDSAANNHQRFVRAQYENVPSIVYDQDKWNTINDYQNRETKQVIDFWILYNQHLLDLVKRTTPENLMRKCHTGEKETHTLAWLMEDYVHHLEHHLKQITDY